MAGIKIPVASRHQVSSAVIKNSNIAGSTAAQPVQAEAEKLTNTLNSLAVNNLALVKTSQQSKLTDENAEITNISFETKDDIITQISYTDKDGKTQILNTEELNVKTGEYTEDDLKVFIDLASNGADIKTSELIMKKIKQGYFKSREELLPGLIKYAKKGLIYREALDLASDIANDYFNPGQIEILDYCLDKMPRIEYAMYAAEQNYSIEKCDMLVKLQRVFSGEADLPKKALDQLSLEQCEMLYSLLSVYNKADAFELIKKGEINKQQIDILNELISRGIDGNTAFEFCKSPDFKQEYLDRIDEISKSVKPDIACFSAVNNFPQKTIELLQNPDGFNFYLKELQNGIGYEIRGAKTIPLGHEVINIDKNGNIFHSIEEAYIFSTKYTVQGSGRSVEICNDKSIIETMYNKDGKPGCIICTRPSEILNGAYETVKYNYSDYPENYDLLQGIKDKTISGGEILSSVIQTKGEIIYSENYEKDGSKISRTYSVQKDENGNPVSSEYQFNIKGNASLSLNRSWRKNQDGSTITIINGKTYTAVFEDEAKTISITDDKGNVHKINIKHKFEPNNTENKKNEFWELCKNSPADMLLEYESARGINLNGWNSRGDNEVLNLTAENSHDNLATVSHELGHQKDAANKISTNSELIKIYLEEAKDFRTKYTSSIQDIISYFLETSLGHNGGLSELTAETNMLMTTYGHGNDLSLRGQYLVRHFPKTIAKIAELSGYTAEQTL